MTRRVLLAPVAIGAVAVAIAGCGGGSSSTTSSQAFDAAAFTQFRSCLAQHGVNGPPGGAPPSGGQPPAGGLPGGGTPSKKMQKAFEACRQYAPQGVPGAPPGGAPTTPGTSG